jgi:hypothetical protein
LEFHTLNAPLSNVSLAVSERPSLVVVLLGLVGFLVDFLVRPISAAGLVLLLLAASPFVVRMLKSPQPVSRIQAAAPAIPVSQEPSPGPKAAAPGAGTIPQQAKPRTARPAELERAPAEPRRADLRAEAAAAARPATNRVPRFEEPIRPERQRSPAE